MGPAGVAAALSYPGRSKHALSANVPCEVDGNPARLEDNLVVRSNVALDKRRAASKTSTA